MGDAPAWGWVLNLSYTGRQGWAKGSGFLLVPVTTRSFGLGCAARSLLGPRLRPRSWISDL